MIQTGKYNKPSEFMSDYNINFTINKNYMLDHYNTQNNTINLKKDEFNATFFHELNHYYDYQNNTIKIINIVMLYIHQATIYTSIFYFIWLILFPRDLTILYSLMVLYAINGVYSVQEELRCYVSGFVSSYIFKNKKYFRV